MSACPILSRPRTSGLNAGSTIRSDKDDNTINALYDHPSHIHLTASLTLHSQLPESNAPLQP
ncbi:hypothetical protein E2C01_040415 [Portunus trituberculatus]|uniref:Uncharacterized protein n=1 Tax=Portunus trituberculatus TaxID=210409 RepID=A0A5B7FGE8_PORTR|nr:hypothetical protein [Portunus trituberculatus]